MEISKKLRKITQLIYIFNEGRPKIVIALLFYSGKNQKHSKIVMSNPQLLLVLTILKGLPQDTIREKYDLLKL